MTSNPIMPTPVCEHYVLTLLQSSSCFAINQDGDKPMVCGSIPCACAQSLLEEIGKPLQLKIRLLQAALEEIVNGTHAYGADCRAIAQKALEL